MKPLAVKVRPLVFTGLSIHVVFVAWPTIASLLSPSNISDWMSTTGLFVFFFHALVATFFDPFLRGAQSFAHLFSVLLMTFPVSLLWAFLLEKLLNCWQKRRATKHAIT
jgi:hypothetical protein